MTTGRINQVTTFPRDRSWPMKPSPPRARSSTQGEGGSLLSQPPPFSLTKEFIDQSWVFPVRNIVKLSQTERLFTHDVDVSDPTCLVSQSRKFQARFALFR